MLFPTNFRVFRVLYLVIFFSWAASNPFSFSSNYSERTVKNCSRRKIGTYPSEARSVREVLGRSKLSFVHCHLFQIDELLQKGLVFRGQFRYFEVIQN